MAYHHHRPEERQAILKRKLRTRSKDGRVEAAFREVHANTPAVVKKFQRKGQPEHAEKIRTAIALSKARAAGARIPKR